VAAHDEAEAAEQQQGRYRAVAHAIEFASRDCRERENDRHPGPGREPRGVVQRQGEREQLRECGRSEVEQRRLLEERLAGERRHHPRAASQQVVDHAEGVGLVGLPRIVADEPRQDPGGAEQRHQRAALRHHLRNLPALPRGISMFFLGCLSGCRCKKRES
jgi:hypothetical protein